MSDSYDIKDITRAIGAASELLSSRKEEINRLNVFPVPDGDTGTNMSLTLQSVVGNLRSLSSNAAPSDYRKAITTGALMGARGNSGVITSQILRGLCEGAEPFDCLDTACLASAFKKAQEVAFQAVRKPVAGTILTVLEDCTSEAVRVSDAGLSINDAMNAIVEEAFASVERTPDFLPVLKENNVVDAGGFGLAIFFQGIASSLQGTILPSAEFEGITSTEPRVEIEQIDDWEGSKFRYCNEFLVDSDELNVEEALEFLSTMGDCELCVGSTPKFKVHVHSNHPDQVLQYFLERGQIFEVFIHNMDLQSQDRARKLASESADLTVTGMQAPKSSEAIPQISKPLGFVAVCAGHGNARILKSLGVDVVVEGGQTMNPSTKDLLEAIEKVPSDKVIVLPNNSNIVMAANSACELSEKECGVVPTKSLPEGIAAMFAVDLDGNLTNNIKDMIDATSDVHTGEVTVAVKSSKDKYGNKIRKGDVIGITDGEIETVGKDVGDVTLALLGAMDTNNADTLTLLGGEDLDEAAFESLTSRIEDAFPDIDVDAHNGGQPLYPVVFSVE